MPVTQLPPSQAIDRFQYDDDPWTFTFTTNGSIAGDTYELILTTQADPPALVTTIIPTISDPGSSVSKGVIVATLAGLLGIAAGDYRWECRRTNANRNKVIANGTLSLSASLKNAS